MAVIADISIGITITVKRLQYQTKRPAQVGLFFMGPSFRGIANGSAQSAAR
jgi:hypothetical protein